MRVRAAGTGDVLELRAGRLIERPPFRTMPAGGRRAIERSFAFAAIKACQVPAGQGHPNDAVAVDVHSPRREAPHRSPGILPWDFVICGQSCFRRIRSRIQADDPSWETE